MSGQQHVIVIGGGKAGLFAAGEVTGGFHGESYMIGGALAKSRHVRSHCRDHRSRAGVAR